MLAAKDDEGNEWAADASGPSVLLFVLGLLGLYPSMRARLIAWLAIRGEASASAASLAQVMGAGKPADVIRTVQARLRCVPAHMLRLVDISSDVIPFDVAERTRPAQIGEIDAFVSHRCAAALLPRTPARRRPSCCLGLAAALLLLRYCDLASALALHRLRYAPA